MASPQQTITGELRKWRLHKIDPEEKGQLRSGTVVGKMYNDINDIYEDGDEAIVLFNDWVESPNFYLAITKYSCVKCPKDEENPHGAHKAFNNSDNPEKG